MLLHSFTARASNVQYDGNIISLQDVKVTPTQILVYFDHVRIHSIFNILLLTPSDVCATMYIHIHTQTHTRSYIYMNFNRPYANSHIFFLPVLKTGCKSSKLTSWIIQLLSLIGVGKICYLIMYTRNPKLTIIIPRASRDSTLVMTKTLIVLGDVATPGISIVCCT
jgi:hypothetical protein